VTEVPKPIDTALDLFVYAPVGLALTAVEELPKMATKGRTRITNRISVARVVGQFAVARGRQELEKRFASPVPESAPAVPRPAAAPAPEPVVHANGSDPQADAAAPDLPGTHVVEESPVVTISAVGALPDPGPAPDASELGIPGYDSLSASQVVQRLAGLRQDELTAVAAYERSHRGRRTVLNRIEQLRTN
jgi:hypothetical protein